MAYELSQERVDLLNSKIPDQACQAFDRSRELFAEYDHHTLVAFSFLNE